MSQRTRYSARRDASEPAIFRALRDAGADVLPLNAFDALVLYRGSLVMLDCKTDGGRQTKKQKDLLARGFPLQFATTPAEALRLIGVK